VKRFIVALIIAAGGLAAAALAIPKTAATVQGTAITQNALNDDVTAIANSPDYQCYLNAQAYLESSGQQITAPLGGAGQSAGTTAHPTATTAFVGPYVATKINQVMVENLATSRGLTVTSKEITEAQTELEGQITETMSEAAQHTESPNITCGAVPLTGKEVLATMPGWFNNQAATANATAGVLENSLSGANTTAGLMQYFNAHRSLFDTACFTDAEYSSQADATAAAKQVAAGTPFAQVAAAAAEGSGPQGCQNLYGIAQQLSSVIDLNTLKTNTVSPPLSVGGTYILLEITSRTPTSFAKAESSVHEALSQVGGTDAGRLLVAAEKRVPITVDPRYGTWKPGLGEVALPIPPPVDDVLNPGANLPATASAASPTPSGTGSSGTGSSGTGSSG
jgi:PPIC-type PPIASE domain